MTFENCELERGRKEIMPTYSRYIVAAALSASCILGCHTQPSAPTAPTRPSDGIAQSEAYDPDYLNVAEAVFRHQFDHNASGLRRDADYFFIALDKGDPPQALLARFANERPPVLPASLAASSAGGGIKHKDSGGRGLIFRIGSIKWPDANTAEVEGGYYEAGLSSSGNVYRVERRGGKWFVTKDEMRWIS